MGESIAWLAIKHREMRKHNPLALYLAYHGVEVDVFEIFFAKFLLELVFDEARFWDLESELSAHTPML